MSLRYPPRVLIRQFAEPDWPLVWAIIRDIVQAEETFPYNPAMTDWVASVSTSCTANSDRRSPALTPTHAYRARSLSVMTVGSERGSRQKSDR